MEQLSCKMRQKSFVSHCKSNNHVGLGCSLINLCVAVHIVLCKSARLSELIYQLPLGS